MIAVSVVFSLYPEGGGQPSDMGSLHWGGGGGGGWAPVVYVYRDDRDEVFHRVKMAAALPVDSEVEVRLDWQRRWDHMQQHSSQHLISALAVKLVQWVRCLCLCL